MIIFKTIKAGVFLTEEKEKNQNGTWLSTLIIRNISEK